jgi:hypothetical protein
VDLESFALVTFHTFFKYSGKLTGLAKGQENLQKLTKFVATFRKLLFPLQAEI